MIVASIGESVSGQGKGINRFLYVIWGTGVGGSMVERLNGKLHISPSEWGHQSIDWSGIPCPCGQSGCLENYIGGRAFNSLYGVSADQITDDNIWEEVAEKAAFGLYNSIHTFPVDLIVFGGGLVTKQPHLLNRIKNYLTKRLKVFSVPQLRLSERAERNGIYGAVNLFYVDRI